MAYLGICFGINETTVNAQQNNGCQTYNDATQHNRIAHWM